jgi:hypothetical protein
VLKVEVVVKIFVFVLKGKVNIFSVFVEGEIVVISCVLTTVGMVAIITLGDVVIVGKVGIFTTADVVIVGKVGIFTTVDVVNVGKVGIFTTAGVDGDSVVNVWVMATGMRIC